MCMWACVHVCVPSERESGRGKTGGECHHGTHRPSQWSMQCDGDGVTAKVSVFLCSFSLFAASALARTRAGGLSVEQPSEPDARNSALGAVPAGQHQDQGLLLGTRGRCLYPPRGVRVSSGEHFSARGGSGPSPYVAVRWCYT